MRNVKVTSFSLPEELRRRLDARLWAYGDRSKLLNRLLELWLNNELYLTSGEKFEFADSSGKTT